VLRHFEDERAAGIVDVERVEDRGLVALEPHIDDGADDLGDRPDDIGRRGLSHVLGIPWLSQHSGVMPGLVPGIHGSSADARRGWPEQARP
jgi:hypothetical protein